MKGASVLVFLMGVLVIVPFMFDLFQFVANFVNNFLFPFLCEIALILLKSNDWNSFSTDICLLFLRDFFFFQLE